MVDIKKPSFSFRDKSGIDSVEFCYLLYKLWYFENYLPYHSYVFRSLGHDFYVLDSLLLYDFKKSYMKYFKLEIKFIGHIGLSMDLSQYWNIYCYLKYNDLLDVRG